MKKKQLLCVLLTGLMLLVPYSGVLAEEPEIQTEELTLASGVEGEEAMISRFDRYVMTEGQEYELDLDGDGKTETISYKDTSVTDEDNGNCQAKAEIYRNGELLFSLESSEYTYYWRLSYCTMKDGKTCLLAASVSDNDWTAELLLLSQEDEDSLTILGDLTEFSRKNDETSENFLSGWARFGYVSPSEKENQFTVTWSETLRATGIVEADLTYELTEEGIRLLEPPYKIYRLGMDGELNGEGQDWTAISALDVKKEPGSEETAYTVQPEETVKLLETTCQDGKIWILCENSSKEQGCLRIRKNICMMKAQDAPAALRKLSLPADVRRHIFSCSLV